MLTVRTSSLAGTHAVAAAIAGLARSGDLIVLAGEMGAGKTAFAQGFGTALGVTEPITSPTFTLVHTYDTGRIDLHHADLYRLDRTLEVADLALGELLESNGVVLVEWGDVLGNSLGDHLLLRLAVGEPADVVDPVGAVEDDAGVAQDEAERDEAFDGEDESTGPTVRVITVQPFGSSWARRWSSLEAALDAVAPC